MNSIDWKNATPEQINLWKKVTSLLVGVQTITPLYYQGVSAGSEFLTYDVKKLYLALDVSSHQYTLNIATNILVLYNEANAISLQGTNLTPVWDTTAALMKSGNNDVLERNVYFSRLTCATYLRFNGYKITIP
jgi:hypothetical protein